MRGWLKSLSSVIVASIEPSKQRSLRCTIETGLPRHLAGIKGCVAWPVALTGKDQPLGYSSQAGKCHGKITLTLKIKVEKETDALFPPRVEEKVSRCSLRVMYCYVMHITAICKGQQAEWEGIRNIYDIMQDSKTHP